MNDKIHDIIEKSPGFVAGVLAGVRYFGADDGYPRHDWCRSAGCIACGCARDRPCISHSEARGYVDWVRQRGLNASPSLRGRDP